MEPIVRAENLSKKFGELTAVNGINFEIFPGECFAFLGPNGAGKTTTVKMIYTVVPFTEGKIAVFNKDVSQYPREIKANTGVCPQEINLDPDFSVMGNLVNYARYFGLKKNDAFNRANTLIDFFQLGEKKDEKIENLSGGLKKRLLVARALINEPKLLILNEPTTGLDPQARHQIWDRIMDLKKSGTTIILTTHYMEEASLLCDRVAIMDEGKIVETGVPDELVIKYLGRDVIEIVDFVEGFENFLKTNHLRYEIYARRAFIYTDDGDIILSKVKENARAGRIILRRAGLEDVFLKLTGRQLRE